MDYKISVIVPLYNAEPYIIETLESVKKQTIGFENIQLIVVDDCSADGGYDLVQKWSAGKENMVVTKTACNSGSPALPRNIGLDLAEAPYVMFLDNDDAYIESACEVLFQEIETTKADIVSGDSVLMESDVRFTPQEKEKLLWHTETIPEGEHSFEEGIGDWIVPFLNNHWCKVYKKELIDRYHIRSLEGEIWEDILFLFLYLSQCSKCVYIKKPIVCYRARKESLSHVHGPEFYQSIPKSMDFGKERADALGITKRYLSLVNYGFGITEYYIDELLGNESLSETDVERCLLAWQNPLIYCGNDGFEFHSAYCRILSNDMKRGEKDQAVFHFHELKRLYLQRKAEINSITESKTYKLARAVGKLLGR